MQTADSLFRAGNRDLAERVAMHGLIVKGNPRGCYELGMLFYWEGDYIHSVLWNEWCLQEVPDWPYSFLAMHSIAASYHKAGYFKMADQWARSALGNAPYFEPARSFLMHSLVVGVEPFPNKVVGELVHDPKD